MDLRMRGEREPGANNDDRLENTLTFERRTRRRDFIVENLQNIENEHDHGESHKRRIGEFSFVQDKRARYDNDSENSTANCKFCRQSWRKAKLNCFDDNDFPKSHKEETILKNENLNIFSDDEKAQIKLTSYSVYDEKGHLCPFDNDIIKDGALLYAAGFVKPIHSENSEILDGIPMRKIGPIMSWWITGFDGGEKAILGISTDVADYYLMKPSSKYEPFLKEAHHKMYMVKLVIEFLKESEECDATYDNLLYKLQVTVPPPGFKTLSEEDLLTYADSVYDLVINYDHSVNADTADRLFVNTPCMRHLARLAGISFEERLRNIRFHKKNLSWMKRNSEMTKAATTNLVEDVFESFFPEQMDKSFSNNVHLMKECYVLLNRCDYQDGESDEDDEIDHTLSAVENLPAFKELTVVLEKIDMKSYKNNETTWNGAYGRPFSILLESWTDEMIEKYIQNNKSNGSPVSIKQKKGRYNFRNSRSFDVRVKFIGEPILIQDDRYYFREAMVSQMNIQVDNFVAIGEYYESSNRIGRVIYMWEEDDEKLFHIHWLVESTNTILGEIGNSQELFDTYDCDDMPIYMIENKVNVAYLPIDRSTWMTSGNASYNEWRNSSGAENENSFIYQKLYHSNFGRFEDVEEVNLNKHIALNHCPYCERNHKNEFLEKPIVDKNPKFSHSTNEYSYGSVRWRNEVFKVGSCIFLKSGALFQHERSNDFRQSVKLKDVDEERYPEMYRKAKERKFIRGEEIVDPFDIGYIVSIHSTKKPSSAKNISLTVKKLYRPQDTHLDEHIAKQLDLNLLYWSDEESIVSFAEVEGKCFVVNLKNLSCSVDEWTKEGPYRFYYEEAYVSKDKKFTSAPTTITREIKSVGTRVKSISTEKIIEETPHPWPSISRPLRSLDIFAGCGGLTEGLHQAGVANCCWAIEKEEAAAHAFRLNYPNALVYTEDCNELLKLIMNGQTRKDGQALPQKGEVELLCGGPPCQGFSRMNRFNNRQYSCFKNSLVVSFLSYVDYFRPRYVIMENVRNFVAFKKNMVLKLTLQCLIKMGYQCTFGVLQAGHFGVPQSRRRAIILAAAPGEILPSYPEPTNAFEEDAISLCIDGQKVSTNVRWAAAAPFRKLKVYDAISDLPVIEIGGDPSLSEMSYKHEAKTHFQRMMRKSNDILRDHVCKTVNPLVEKRISFIPRSPGSDWRNLPNIVVQLSDGTYTKKLVYTHHDLQNGKAKNGRFRGVCCCASGKKCDSKYRQVNTMIPWCLPHTGNRNHHWSGLYGRIEWDSHFKTVITNLDPLAKQGKVLHPEQDRIVSIREVARSQGFPDKFRFFGNTQDRYRQIGNAVPPPLAAALGREIAKAVADVEKREA